MQVLQKKSLQPAKAGGPNAASSGAPRRTKNHQNLPRQKGTAAKKIKCCLKKQSDWMRSRHRLSSACTPEVDHTLQNPEARYCTRIIGKKSEMRNPKNAIQKLIRCTASARSAWVEKPHTNRPRTPLRRQARQRKPSTPKSRAQHKGGRDRLVLEGANKSKLGGLSPKWRQDVL